jgi:hypothetical protein
MRVFVLLAVALLLAACDRGPAPPVAGARPVGAACVSRVEGTRWAGEYHPFAVFGDAEEEAMSGISLGGIAATDSIVYVMESGRPALWLLRPDLSVIRRVGREGDGPGEWRTFSVFTQGGSMRRVSASRERVRIFDGRRVQELEPTGRFRRMVVDETSAERLSDLQSRLVYAGDTLFYSAGGHDPLSSAATGRARAVGAGLEVGADGRRLWAVRMRVDDEDRSILQLGLVPVRGKGGVGPAHARPLWDSNGGCVVGSDGAEPLLIVAPVGGRQDTVRVPLPERVDRNENYADKLGGLPTFGTRLEEPSAPWRVMDLVLDPDGFVWLLPVQPDEPVPGGVEVLRVPLGGGTILTDTVPAFPRAFGPPGVYFAGTRGPNDEIQVTRYDLDRRANANQPGGDDTKPSPGS